MNHHAPVNFLPKPCYNNSWTHKERTQCIYNHLLGASYSHTQQSFTPPQWSFMWNSECLKGNFFDMCCRHLLSIMMTAAFSGKFIFCCSSAWTASMKIQFSTAQTLTVCITGVTSHPNYFGLPLPCHTELRVCMCLCACAVILWEQRITLF